MKENDAAALGFLAGACFALLLYRVLSDAYDLAYDTVHALRKPRVEWHVFGPDVAENVKTAAATKDAAPGVAGAEAHAKTSAEIQSTNFGSSGHIKATRP